MSERDADGDIFAAKTMRLHQWARFRNIEITPELVNDGSHFGVLLHMKLEVPEQGKWALKQGKIMMDLTEALIKKFHSQTGLIVPGMRG